MTVMISTLWQKSEDDKATICNDHQTLQIDLNRPNDGLQLIDSSCSANLFKINLPNPSTATECYIRKNDVIATTEEVTADQQVNPVRRQIYWRNELIEIENNEFLALQAIISSQTSLLDSNPETYFQSQIDATQLLQLSDTQNEVFEPIAASSSSNDLQTTTRHPACFIVRCTQDDLSYVEMIHPADFYQAEFCLHKNKCLLRYQLFGKHLEKGVILRSRLQGVFLPRTDDQKIAAKLYHMFIAAKIPLTT